MQAHLSVAAFQGSIKEGDWQANLAKAIKITRLAEKSHVDILAFPETFLHGYFPTKELALANAINLKSAAFKHICQQFAKFNCTVLLGLNEIVQKKIYNTVVVIERGRFLGKYRKAYTYSPYDYYALGRDFPVFEKKGIKFGIIICVDSAFREPAHIVALKGARIIFCPSFNRVQHDVRMFQYLNRKNHFISRAFDNHCWVVVSDIIWDAKDEACPGYSSIFNNNGELVAKAEPFQEKLLTYSIPLASLHEQKPVRLFGNAELNKIMSKAYQQAIKKRGK